MEYLSLLGTPPPTHRQPNLAPDTIAQAHISSTRLCRTPTFIKPPTNSNQEQFDPNQVFPLPPPSSGDEALLFSDGSKAGSKAGAALVHLHPSGSIIKPHLLPLPWYMSAFGAELYAASCALQHATSLSYGPTYVLPSPTPRPSPHSKAVSLSIDNQATISTISCPGYSYVHGPPPSRHPQRYNHAVLLRLCSPSRTDAWALRHHWPGCMRPSVPIIEQKK